MTQVSQLNLLSLGNQVRTHREHKGLSQQALVDAVGNGLNRSHVSYLEQGSRLPPHEVLKLICEKVDLPPEHWEPFSNPRFVKRLEFESILQELTGSLISTTSLDPEVVGVLEEKIDELIPGRLSVENSLSALNSILVFYDIRRISPYFYERYLKEALSSFDKFRELIVRYQRDAIRLFSTMSSAFEALNSESKEDFESHLAPLNPKELDEFTDRTDWEKIENIPNSELPYLGYIAARQVKEEEAKRQELSHFLLELAESKKQDKFDVEQYSPTKRRRMDSLLREFNSTIQHGLFSPLFKPDVETLEAEAVFISPERSGNLELMEETQKKAYRNLAHYLSADFLDVYVATSMRSNADFVSVNDFVQSLFAHDEIRHLKLRYFNPTQSWIEDRVAKGLVEALMLKRAAICIYMAQKEDTFGKDSEASVTLGQGKPVIVFVPKLEDQESKIDSESFARMERNDLISRIKEQSSDEIDEAEDNESLMGRLLTLRLEKLSSDDFARIVRKHWADFDLEGEFTKRINRDEELTKIRSWFKRVVGGSTDLDLDPKLASLLVRILVAVSIRFEQRARVFREVHPLALQVILSTGVLNGILVVRSFEDCAFLVKQLVENRLNLDLEIDENNYKLIERNTRSVIRVISKNPLISNAFDTFYRA